MRKRLRLWVTVALTGVGSAAIVAGGLQADGGGEPQARAIASAAPASLAQGRALVTSVDADAGRVVLSLTGEEVQLRVDDRTTVFVDGRPGGLEEIEPGQAVCAAWTAERAPVAEWIEPCAR